MRRQLTRLINLNLFRGDRELIEPDDLRREVRSAFEQRRLGLATVSEEPPDVDAGPVDVAKLFDSQLDINSDSIKSGPTSNLVGF